MTEFRQGLVIGKFYPLHLGHVRLIEHAAGRCEQLAILVMASQRESMTLGQRMAWMREATNDLGNVTVIGVLDDAPVDYDSEIAWVAHHRLMVAALANRRIPTIDAVFSSEAYGGELAARFNAASVIDDLERRRVPISGTMARADPARHWRRISEPARRELATRIIVVGAESTGTTTLAEGLLEHYRARIPTIEPVEEYGRQFTYRLHDESTAAARMNGSPAPSMDDLVWTTEHFRHIAETQTMLEDSAALASPLVIADTDALATSIWERRYVGSHSHGAADAAGPSLPRRDLYLVTDHTDVPFEQDGWRDGEHIRAEMTQWFVEGLTARVLPWVFLRGATDVRLDYAVRAIDGLLREDLN